MDKNKQLEANALIDMVESERIESITSQLEKLKPSPLAMTANIVAIFGLVLFFWFFIPGVKEDTTFFYVISFVVIALGISTTESYRANKRIDLIVKLLKINNQSEKI